MPFMAYGADCSGLSVDTCDTRPGCRWNESEYGISCEPCGIGTYNTGDNPNSSGCIACTNAPADCGTDDSQCTWLTGSANTGLTSNNCPWQLTCDKDQEYDKTDKECADCTSGFYNDDPVYIYNGRQIIGRTCLAKQFKITLKYQIDDTIPPVDVGSETVTVLLKTYPQLSISAVSYENTLRNQYSYGTATLSYNDMSCPMAYISADKQFVSTENKDCYLLLKHAPKEDAELTLTLTVTAKDFQYVLVPMNSVENGKDFTIGTDKNTSDVKTGTFGKTVTVSSDTEYYQYNNCTYDTAKNTYNCKFDDDTKPTTHSDKINYELKYSDDTIIVLERATCTPGEYCPTYKADDDKPCPPAFSSDENSATSITDCYLDSSVTFVDDNNKNGFDLIGQYPDAPKVYYRGNSTQ